MALNATTRIAALKEREVRIDRMVTATTAGELVPFLRGVSRAVQHFVPAEQRKTFNDAVRAVVRQSRTAR